MNSKENKMKNKMERLLKNIGIGYYNFKTETAQPKVQKERLTSDKMKDLFGTSYKDIVYFNFDTGTWNRPNYLGFTVGNQKIDTKDALEMRRMCELEPQMQALEVVASVTMATSDEDYPGTERIAKEPVYKRSRNIVGTLLLRDKVTGRILAPASCWLGVEAYPKMSIAAFYGADGLAYKLANNGQLRNKFISELVSQIQR